MTMREIFTPDDVVSSYSRAQAIADGELVDVTDTAAEAGFKVPVALSREVWADCVEWKEADNARKGTLQDQSGRLWDVVYMAFQAARRALKGQPRVLFSVYRVPREGKGVQARPVNLLLQIGPGDDALPVITITTP